MLVEECGGMDCNTNYSVISKGWGWRVVGGCACYTINSQ